MMSELRPASSSVASALPANGMADGSIIPPVAIGFPPAPIMACIICIIANIGLADIGLPGIGLTGIGLPGICPGIPIGVAAACGIAVDAGFGNPELEDARMSVGVPLFFLTMLSLSLVENGRRGAPAGFDGAAMQFSSTQPRLAMGQSQQREDPNRLELRPSHLE